MAHAYTYIHACVVCMYIRVCMCRELPHDKQQAHSMGTWRCSQQQECCRKEHVLRVTLQDACTHARTNAHTHARTHARTHAHTHTHTHTHTRCRFDHIFFFTNGFVAQAYSSQAYSSHFTHKLTHYISSTKYLEKSRSQTTKTHSRTAKGGTHATCCFSVA